MSKLGIIILLVVCGVAPTAPAAEIRYTDVVYLDELEIPPVQLRVLKRTPISLSRDLMSAMAYLPQGSRVRLLGWTEDLCYVQGRISTGAATGWVKASAIETPAPTAVADWQARAARQARHRELIARKEVAVGMTRAEVRASLGRPDRIRTIRTAEQDAEEWWYITYRYQQVSQPWVDSDGRWRQSVTYRRLPAGQRRVVFDRAAVVVIEEEAEGQGARSPADR